jgi:hypothetical protein
VLFARSVQVEQKTKFGPTLPFSFGVFGSNVGASWSGPAGSANVSRYKEYTSETALSTWPERFGLERFIKTTEPENVQTAISSMSKRSSRRSKPKSTSGASDERCSSKAATAVIGGQRFVYIGTVS